MAPFLDSSSHHACLLTSKTFALVVIPLLYRTIPIKREKPCALVASADQGSADETALGPLSRQACLSHVRTLEVYWHDQATCIGASTQNLPSLPNLQHLHMAGGHRFMVLKTCLKYCPLLQHYADQFIRLTLRNFIHLPDLPNVTALTFILRPCQIPHHEISHGPESTLCVLHAPMTFRGISSVTSVDIVFWDEQHQVRIDYIIDTFSLGAAGHVAVQKRDCQYCDERHRASDVPNVPVQLSQLLYCITQLTATTHIKVWNADRAAEQFQGVDTPMDLPRYRRRMKRLMLEGVRERKFGPESPGPPWGGEVSGIVFGSEDGEEESEDEESELDEDSVSVTGSWLEDEKVELEYGSGDSWVSKLVAEGRTDEMRRDERYWEALRSLPESES